MVSDMVNITSSIIQGSCLAHILFVLCINSIVKVLPDNVTCLLFADNVQIYTVIRSDADKINLQNVLHRISDWSVNWQMSISVKNVL